MASLVTGKAGYRTEPTLTEPAGFVVADGPAGRGRVQRVVQEGKRPVRSQTTLL